jgi:hypothetical protein
MRHIVDVSSGSDITSWSYATSAFANGGYIRNDPVWQNHPGCALCDGNAGSMFDWDTRASTAAESRAFNYEEFLHSMEEIQSLVMPPAENFVVVSDDNDQYVFRKQDWIPVPAMSEKYVEVNGAVYRVVSRLEEPVPMEVLEKLAVELFGEDPELPEEAAELDLFLEEFTVCEGETNEI